MFSACVPVGAKLCGTQHLNIPDGVKAVAPGQPGGNKVTHQTLRSLAVRFQEEEVVGLAALCSGSPEMIWCAFSTMRLRLPAGRSRSGRQLARSRSG